MCTCDTVGTLYSNTEYQTVPYIAIKISLKTILTIKTIDYKDYIKTIKAI